MHAVHTITFPQGHLARAISIATNADIPTALTALGIPSPKPTIVLVGGASGLSKADQVRLQPLFSSAIAPQAEALGACIVDGGTDAGIMALLGRTRTATYASFPLIGVAPRALVAIREEKQARQEVVPLEPNHTHFMFVPGTKWGDESAWIARIASGIADHAPSVTLLINGGDIAWQDVAESTWMNRKVLVISKSGRTADTIVATLRGKQTDQRAAQLIESGLIQVVESIDDPGVLALALAKALATSK